MPVDEQWRPVPGYEGIYSVSDRGRVWSHPRKATNLKGYAYQNRTVRGRFLKHSYDSAGYPYVNLSKEGKAWPHRIHVLVCTAFHGPPPSDGLHVLHWNDVKTDNYTSNLRWGTPTQNQRDYARNEKARLQGLSSGV